MIIIANYLLILKRIANKKLSKYNQLITHQKDKLEEANAAKDKLFSLIGHDLKTPFYVILRYTQLLKNQFNELSEIEKKENIDELFDYTREIYTILENMLTWSRSQKGIIHIKKEKIILNSFIDSTIKPYLTDAKNKSITINNEIDEATVIFADRYTIGTTINNLFYNAVKFTPVGGHISFESKKLEHDGIQISITDSGVGIKEDDIKKLFQIGGSFSTEGTEKEKGTGLGLIICKEFVEYNNGSISVTSKPNEGSIFSITLPLN
jgi:signal transduction histidine kinase